jgi:sarcosine oxidase subunit beta
VGAGITGASTAYHLRRGGAERVLLLERQAPAAGGTGRSAAIVRQHYSTALMARLALASIVKLERLPEELGVSGAFTQSGYLMLLPLDLVATAEANLALQRSVGVETEWVSQCEWEQRFPWLNSEGVGGIVFEPRGGYADPVRVTEAHVAAFARLGGELRVNTPCRGLLRRGDRVTGVLLNDGEVASGAIVNAAGPWAHFLAASASITLPLRTVREQDSIWQMLPGWPVPTASISDAWTRSTSDPWRTGGCSSDRAFQRSMWDVDPYNFRQTVDDGFTSLIQRRIEARCPALAGMTLISAYAALYDVNL